jgi:hypothetical protein
MLANLAGNDVYRYKVISRRKNYETEFAVYRYGFAYLAGLSDPVCVRKTSPVFNIRSKHPVMNTNEKNIIVKFNRTFEVCWLPDRIVSRLAAR